MSTRALHRPSGSHIGLRARPIRFIAALALSALASSGCYVAPVGAGPDGRPVYVYSAVPIVPAAGAASGTVAGAPAGPMPAQLNVRLYPANDLAIQTGLLSGQVTNLMSGKGRFQFSYQGEMLAGEATRVSGTDRRGVASAYGPSGTFARCEYQMSTPYQGAGTCKFSNGAEYQVHIGG